MLAPSGTLSHSSTTVIPICHRDSAFHVDGAALVRITGCGIKFDCDLEPKHNMALRKTL
jgi:hypothetical protein